MEGPQFDLVAKRHAGKKFGKLTAVKPLLRTPSGSYRWLWRCECGATREALYGQVRRGITSSCGCSNNSGNHVHGMSHSTEYGMLKRSKVRASRHGLEHTIELSDIKIPEYCPIFPHIKLEVNRKGPPSDPSPSLDRIDSTKGYTPDNIWVISNRANRLKGDAEIHELIQIADAVARKTQAADTRDGGASTIQRQDLQVA